MSGFLETDLVLWAGAAGLLAGLVFFLVFLHRRIRFLIKKSAGKSSKPPKLLESLRSLLLIFLWTAVFGMVLFAGFFFRAYRAFTLEEPVAEVVIDFPEEGGLSSITLVQESLRGRRTVRRFDVAGEQWVLEGDILKWNNWLNFLGLHTRYRLTRLRSRYLQTSDEQKKPSTIHALAGDEDHPLWRYLYRYGPRLPLVSTVYGNAVFQSSGEDAVFKVFVTTSGFMARRVEPTEK